MDRTIGKRLHPWDVVPCAWASRIELGGAAVVGHPDSSLLLRFGRPRLIGVVNITSDSFSDGGRYLATEDALAHARRLRAAGADIIELGPAASHPDAQRVTAEEEIERLAGVIDELVAADIPVSVDSFRPETQRFAGAHGAAYLNDIQGFPDPRRYEELADLSCRLIVMHSVQRSGPATRVLTAAEQVWTGIERFFDERLSALQTAGVDRERLVIDPGLGYFLGRTAEPSVLVLDRLRALKARFDLPVLVSPSRKSFLRRLTGRDLEHAGPATLAAELSAACRGVDFIRTHDVAAVGDALTVFQALDAARRGWAAPRSARPPRRR
jgi:dihydropteroate synthase type 2